MKEGDTVYITDGTYVCCCMVSQIFFGQLTGNSLLELKPTQSPDTLNPYLRRESEVYKTKQEALTVSIAFAEQELDKAEQGLVKAQGELRWAKRTLKKLRKELEKEEKQNGNNVNN